LVSEERKLDDTLLTHESSLKGKRGENLRISRTLCKHVLKYRVIIEKDEDGILVAKVPDLPGCATEGKTRAELMKNVKEAIQAYIEALKEHGEPVPIETVQVSV
jgi:predicted RNase H-like HicB family nuclease